MQVAYLRDRWRTGGTRDTGKGREGGPSQVYHQAQSAVMTGAEALWGLSSLKSPTAGRGELGRQASSRQSACDRSPQGQLILWGKAEQAPATREAVRWCNTDAGRRPVSEHVLERR